MHLATRGNNKIRRTPPPHISISEEILFASLVAHLPNAEQINHSFFGRKNFIQIKILQKKYSVGIMDMIKLRNIYNTYTYIPIYIQLNTHIYM